MSDRKFFDMSVDIVMTAASIDPPVEFPLDGVDEVTFDASGTLSIAWVASTLTFEVCNDRTRANWQAPATGAVTITGIGISDVVNVTPYMWGRLRVSAGAATTFSAHVGIHGEGAS